MTTQTMTKISQLSILFLLHVTYNLPVHVSTNDSSSVQLVDVENSSDLLKNDTTKSNSQTDFSTSPDMMNKYSDQLYMKKFRSNSRFEATSYKMDRTIIGAIIIGCIFLFITLSITITIIIFCLKKNTVFVFQKSEQEDIHDCTYEDCLDSISYQSSLHFDDHLNPPFNSVQPCRRNVKNQKYIYEYFNKCPVELFYPMHYDKPYPAQAAKISKSSHKKCQCSLDKQKQQTCVKTKPVSGSNGKFSDSEYEQLPWHKMHEGSVYKPLFKEKKVISKSYENMTKIKVELDVISQSRTVTNSLTPIVNKLENNDEPILKDFIDNSEIPKEIDHRLKIVLTPLGKSQTFTDINPSFSKDISSNSDISQVIGTPSLLHKSQSDYDPSFNSKRNS